MKSKVIFDIGRPLIMAHRGDPSSAPENTLLSMEMAVEVGVDILETDVRMTRDQELVLFHDDTLERTIGQPGTVNDYTLDDLQEFDAGALFTTDEGKTFPFRGKGLKIVTLREALARFPDIRFNLDIKDKDPLAPSLLASMIHDLEREDSVIVASFHSDQIKRFRKIMPTVATAAGPDEVRRFVLATKIRLKRLAGRILYRAFQIPLSYGPLTVVTPQFIRFAHQNNLAVHAWTINDGTTMEHLIDIGVDGIFTDDPALLRRVLSDRGLI